MYCMKCSKWNPDGSAYCVGCGAELNAGMKPSGSGAVNAPKAADSEKTEYLGMGLPPRRTAAGQPAAEEKTEYLGMGAVTPPPVMGVNAPPQPVVTKKRSVIPIFIVVILVCGLLGAGAAVLYFTVFSKDAGSGRIDAELEKAERYLDDLEYEQAVIAYQHVLELDPRNEDALEGLEGAYIAWAESVREEDPAKAEEIYAEAAEYLQDLIDDCDDDDMLEALEKTSANIESKASNISNNLAGGAYDTDENVAVAAGGDQEDGTAVVTVTVTAANEVGVQENAVVGLYAADGSKVAEARSDGSGRVEFLSVAAGDYTLSCRLTGYNDRVIPVTVANGQDLQVVFPVVPLIMRDDVCVLLEWEGDQQLDLSGFNSEIQEYVNIAHASDSDGGFIYADNDADKGYELIYYHGFSTDAVKNIYVMDRYGAQSDGHSRMEADGVWISVFTKDGEIFTSRAGRGHDEALWNPCYLYEGGVYSTDEYYSDMTDFAWVSLREEDQILVDNSVWKEAYAEVARTFAADHPGNGDWNMPLFKLIYLNDDPIPELVADDSGYYAEVYSIVDGKAEMIYYFGYGAFGRAGSLYCERTGYIEDADNDLAGAICYVWLGYFDGTEVISVSPASMYSSVLTDTNGDGSLYDEDAFNTDWDYSQWHYYIMDEEVSAEEYDSYFPDTDGEWDVLTGGVELDEFLESIE